MSQLENETLGVSNRTNEAALYISVIEPLTEQVTPSRNRPVPLPQQLEECEGTISAMSIPSMADMMVYPMDFENTNTTPFVLERALNSYQYGLVSLGRAAEMAGLHYDSMINELERRGIQLHFGPATPEEAEQEERRFLETFRRSLPSDR